MSFETEACDDDSNGGSDEYDYPNTSDDEFIVADDYVEYMSDDSQDLAQQSQSSNNRKSTVAVRTKMWNNMHK